jgi:hypothetical protein
MSDNYHLSSNENQHQHQHQHQHPQEFNSILNYPSPMTAIAYHNQNWSTLDQTIDDQQYHYDINQQNQHQLQDQYWPHSHQHDSHYSQLNQPQQQNYNYYPEPYTHQLPVSSVSPLYTTQIMDNSFNAPMPIRRNNHIQKYSDPPSTSTAPLIDQSHSIRYKGKNKTTTQKLDNETTTTTTPSPSETPIPSPIITGKRKRRTSTTSVNHLQQKRRIQKDIRDMLKEGEGNHGSYDDVDGGDNGGTTTRRVNNIKETQSNQTVDQLENELAFLRDECATILIMLDSLRNAFLADIPSAGTSLSTVKSNSLSATINFMVEDVGALSTISAPSIHYVEKSSVTNSVDTRRRSKTMAQNPEMEREMRIAYDDLMLQVRQLEKKVERLEGKSKHVCLEEASANITKKHENQMVKLKDGLHELHEDTNSNGDDSGEEDSSNHKKKKQQQ